MKRLLLVLLVSAAAGMGQMPGANYDESKVPRYTLPDLLKLDDGGVVRDAETWQQRRRPEVLALLESQMFGRAPGRPEAMSFELTSIDKAALGGLAVRKEVAINLSGHVLNLLLYLPAQAQGPVPVFVGLNFGGNHAVNADPGVRVAQVWRKTREMEKAAVGPPTARGTEAGRWQVEMILARGYGLATMYYGDIEPDFDGTIASSVRARYLRAGESRPGPGEWGAIGAWAWGLSRARWTVW